MSKEHPGKTCDQAHPGVEHARWNDQSGEVETERQELGKGLRFAAVSGEYPGQVFLDLVKADELRKAAGIYYGKKKKPVEEAELEKGEDEEDDDGEDEAVKEQHAEENKKDKIGKSMLYKAQGGPFIGPRGGKWADAQHKIPWDEKKHAGKATPTAKDHDEHGATNLQLISENSGPDPHSRFDSERGSANQINRHRDAVETNLNRKIAGGKYDHAQATKLWAHHAKMVSDHNAKHYGGGKADPATRMAAAKSMADDFHDNVRDGYHDDHAALAGVHAKRAEAGGGLSKIAQGHGGVSKSMPVSMPLTAARFAPDWMAGIYPQE